MKSYYRPIAQTDITCPAHAKCLAGGWTWFTQVEVLRRGQDPELVDAEQLPAQVLKRLCDPRGGLSGLDMAQPQVMGILNVTPDSFSDGGVFNAPEAAVERVQAMIGQGATLIDIGGESTRPGAGHVKISEEIARTAPVIAALRDKIDVPISIDTRKAPVAKEALGAGASIINDVSGFTWDAELAPLAVAKGVPVCIMHAQGDPATMQDDPAYDDVLLDVYDFLEAQVEMLTAQGVARDQIMVDPGIGFGKTLAHNLALLARISLFHSLGCPILLGASRKRFIGTISGTQEAQDRMAGSVAVALAAVAQGTQVLRVHDVAETTQALALWRAVTKGQM